MDDLGHSSIRRRLVQLAVFVPLLLAFGGAAAQAGNTVLLADLGTTVGDVDPIQGLAFRLMVAFCPLATVGAMLVVLVGRRYGIRLRPSRGAGAWHAGRLAVGLGATALVFQGTALLRAQDQPLGTATLFSNSGGFVTAVLALCLGIGALRLRLLNMVPALLGLGGVYVAVAFGVPASAFVNLPVGLLAAGCFLLGVLALIQRQLSDREADPSVARPPMAKLLVTLKISTVFAAGGALVSTAVYVARVPAHGWLSVDGDVVRASLLLAACYAASQLLLQAANGFGNPGINGPMMYCAVPIGYLLDELRGLDGFTAQHVGGSAMILGATFASFWVVARLKKVGTKGAAGA